MVDDEIEIRRELPDVFAFVSDGQRLPAWMTGVKRVRRTSSPGPVGAGTTYCVRGKLLGRSVESRYELTDFRPGRAFSARMTSDFFSVEDTYQFETGEDGVTTLRLRRRAQPRGRLRLLGPLVTLSVPRQARTDHRRLKAVLERSRRRPVAPSRRRLLRGG